MDNNDMGIDLGTVNTLIYTKNKGIALNEPSVIAIDSYSKKVLAVGAEAKRMLGRTPGTVRAAMPLEDGVIADFDLTSQMLRQFVKKVKHGFGKPNIIISLPSKVTAVEKRAVEDAAYFAGARKVYPIEEPLAAAIGANIPIFEANGHAIIDIGGGTTEAAIISLGGLVSVSSVKCGGNQLDRDIISYVKKNYGVLIGETTAEEIKLNIGNVFYGETVDYMTVSGRDLQQGLPVNIAISSDEVMDALRDSINLIVDCFKQVLEKTPPELSSDIYQNGVLLTGGGALLKGWDKLIMQETGIIANLSEQPFENVARGAGLSLDMLKALEVARG